MDQIQQRGTRFRASSNAGSGSATVTLAATTGRRYFVTDIAGGTDQSSGTSYIELYSNFEDKLWQNTVNRAYNHALKVPIALNSGSAVSLNVRHYDGVGTCFVNIAGYYI